MSNCDFGGELALQVGVIFFQVGLGNSFYKNSEFESQTKQMVPIAFFTISHFWSTTLTTFWQPAFVSLFFMVYTSSPHPQIFSLWVLKSTHSCSQGLGKFKSFWGPYLLWGLNFLFWRGRWTRPFCYIEPSLTNHVNSRTLEGKIICFMCVC